ncbi:hypothetical protein ACLB2K_041492 [Fragaria x ananassa]
MVGSYQPNQDAGSALPSEQILQEINDLQGSLQRIQSNLDQNTETVRQNAETVKQHAKILSLTRATVDEQTRRLDDHDAKLHDQQNASFFRRKNILEKLDEFKEKHDRLNLQVLEVEDWMREQAPKNLALNPIGASTNEGSSKYIPPNERARGNQKVGAQKTSQFALGAGTSKNLPLRGSSVPFKGHNNSPSQGAGTPDDPFISHSSPAPKNVG